MQKLLVACGGLPLALGIVASRAYIAPDAPLAQLASELNNEATRLDFLDDDDPGASLPAVLSWSLRTLTDEQTRVFGLLGLAPGPDISVAATVALTGSTENHIRGVLRALEEASLIEQNGASRYRMHDLIRLQAREFACKAQSGTARQSALRRVVDFYLHTAYVADELLDPHRLRIRLDAESCQKDLGSDSAAAMEWFTAEQQCVLASQTVAVTNGWYEAVWQLAWSLDTFHYRRGHSHDQAVAWLAGVKAAEKLGDPSTCILAHRRLGATYTRLGRHVEALKHLHQALMLAEHIGDVAAQAHTHQFLARAAELRGDDRVAFDHATHAQHLFGAVSNPAWEAAALNQVGWLAARLGRYAVGRSACEAALSLYRQLENRTGEAAVLDSLGYISYHSGNHDQAVDFYEQSLALRRALRHVYNVASTLEGLGNPYLALGRREDARLVWQEAFNLYQEQGRDSDATKLQQLLEAIDHSQLN
ncbi:tetratricopeptide repeat protein [Microbispora sp. CA-102843]|uniref:tetratricopeptide repeat protein n=1 Tax=Microbispora sp. CA-102843 TaxID=3239952 RepID=UPI003D91EB4E